MAEVTQEELLTKIDIRDKYIHSMEGCGPAKLALYEVVKLHKQLIKDDGTNRCEICWTAYPCSTVRVVEEHIG